MPDFLWPMVYSLPGSSVHEILQARILEWVAISFSKGSSWPRDPTHISCTGWQILYHYNKHIYLNKSEWGGVESQKQTVKWYVQDDIVYIKLEKAKLYQKEGAKSNGMAEK